MKNINSCPMNQTEVDRASSILGCGYDEYGNNQYMCLPNAEKTSLVQFCVEGLMRMMEKGYCLKVFEGNVITENCKHFLFGCPAIPWRSHEFYKYPACQAINIRDKCYRLDPSCPTEYNGNKETNFNFGASESQDHHIVIYGVLTTIIIFLASIIVFLLWRRLKYKKDSTIQEENLDITELREEQTGFLENNNVLSNVSCEEDTDTIIENGIQGSDNSNIRSRKRNDTETSVGSHVQEDGDEPAVRRKQGE